MATGDKIDVDTSARPITATEPVMEDREMSRKRKQGDNPDGSTSVGTSEPEKKKRKKEKGKGKEQGTPAIGESLPVEAVVRADETTKPKKRKRDEDGKAKEQNEEKAARKARKADRKLQKFSNPTPVLTVPTELDRSMVLPCNVSLSYALGVNA
jgi:hypothetical protein